MVIASGGNAGIAVAVAARALGVRCEVFVPEIVERGQAGQARRARRGAHRRAAPATPMRSPPASRARRQTGALLMHAYDQREVVVGAGTLAAEVEEEAGVPDRVLVSVGGGGLIAGIAVLVPGPMLDRCARARAGADAVPGARGRPPVDVAVSGIAADSLGARRIGAIAWEVTQRHVDARAPARRRRDPHGAARPVDRCASPSSRRRRCRWPRWRTATVVPRQDERVLLVICGANLDLASLAA